MHSPKANIPKYLLSLLLIRKKQPVCSVGILSVKKWYLWMGWVEDSHEERRRADVSGKFGQGAGGLAREDRRSRGPTPILPHKFGRHLGTFSSHTKIGWCVELRMQGQSKSTRDLSGSLEEMERKGEQSIARLLLSIPEQAVYFERDGVRMDTNLEQFIDIEDLVWSFWGLPFSLKLRPTSGGQGSGMGWWFGSHEEGLGQLWCGMWEKVAMESYDSRRQETPGIVAFSSSAQQHRGSRWIGGGECLDRAKVGNRPDGTGREGLAAWIV